MKSIFVLLFFTAVIFGGVLGYVIDTTFSKTIFPCGVPQPRAYSVREIAEEKLASYDPPSVVLHRCERAGCCSNEKESCQPEEQEEVYLMVNIVGVYMEMKEIKALNHTKCACLNDETAIK